MLKKFETFPRTAILKLMTLVTLIGFIALTILFQFDEATLQAGSGYGIMDFELAFTQATASTILTAWGASLQAIVLRGTYVDFGYIVFYGLLLFSVTPLISRTLKGRWQNIGLIFAFVPLIAGAFDVIENINLIIMLNNPLSFAATIPMIASLCATIKFTFLLVSIGFVAIGGIVWIIRKLGWRKAAPPK